MSSIGERYSFAPETAAPASRQTLRTEITSVGRGLHSGTDVTMTLKPAAPHAGIVFVRSDLGVRIPALFDRVTDTRLCTLISEGKAQVGTVEHLMAAAMACGVDDMIVEVDAPELPVFDGSAAPFLFLIQSAGLVAQGGRRESLQILRPVRVEGNNGAFAELRPHTDGGHGFDVSLSIEFAAAAIGAQAYTFSLTEEGFVDEIADARTFTQLGEIEALRKMGLAKGGSLANAIVVDGEKIVNPEGLRYADEFVRHKLLDVVGDLALAGAPISGRFLGSRTGHALNNQLLRAVFADQANYRLTHGSVTAPALLQLTAA